MTFTQAENADANDVIANTLSRRALRALHKIDNIYEDMHIDNDITVDRILDVIEEFKACDEFEEEE